MALEAGRPDSSFSPISSLQDESAFSRMVSSLAEEGDENSGF